MKRQLKCIKKLGMLLAAMCASVCFAAAEVPSVADVRKVGKYLTDLTKDDLAQMRQKKITKEQYADALAGYASEEQKPAAKFALLRDAFKMYVEAKSYEKADEVYGVALAEGGTEYALAAVGRTVVPIAAKGLKERIAADKMNRKGRGDKTRQEKDTHTEDNKELKPISLPLKGQTSIEFVGVPAGEFTMGTDMFVANCENTSVIKPHKVTITRPFWLSKYKVTIEQWDTYQKTKLTEYQKIMGGNKVAKGNVSYNEAVAFCEFLTKRSRNKLPKGYVVRLPTEAEWEYALRMNYDIWNGDEDWWEKRGEFMVLPADVRRRAAEQKYEIPFAEEWFYEPIAVGTKKPNAIGLYDMMGNGSEFVLDTVNKDLFATVDGWYPLGKKINIGKGLVYDDKETDPLRHCKVKVTATSIVRNSASLQYAHPFFKGLVELHWKFVQNTIRLCIGPDLMKEKGYSKKTK